MTVTWGLPAVLGVVGFGASGVTAGSIAASIQSAIRTPTLVAKAMSIGAAGVSTATSVVAAAVGGAVASEL